MLSELIRPAFPAEIWRGWKSGKTLRGIGQALDRRSSHVRVFVAVRGGIAPLSRRRLQAAARIPSRYQNRLPTPEILTDAVSPRFVVLVQGILISAPTDFWALDQNFFNSVNESGSNSLLDRVMCHSA